MFIVRILNWKGANKRSGESCFDSQHFAHVQLVRKIKTHGSHLWSRDYNAKTQSSWWKTENGFHIQKLFPILHKVSFRILKLFLNKKKTVSKSVPYPDVRNWRKEQSNNPKKVVGWKGVRKAKSIFAKDKI